MKKSNQLGKVTLGKNIKAGRKFNIRTLRGTICFSLVFAMLLTFAAPGMTLARQGDSGYEGGISSGETPSPTSTTKAATSKSYQYKELCFLSGTPVELSGTLSITKTLKDDTKSKTKAQTLTTTYKYVLKNGNNKLDRTLTFDTSIIPKDNGQKTESTQLTKATETLKIGGVTYKIANVTDYELSKSILNDIKPAVNYYAGELWSRKTYSSAVTTNPDTIVVESTGKYYGYDEYWSTAEAQVMKQTISRCKPGKDPVIVGDIDIDISTTTNKQLKYYENLPDQISFEGGYVQAQKNENVLKYTAKLNELDKNKAPTQKINTYTKSLKLESFPTQTRLISPNIKKIKGHPSEESISLLFGLGAFKDAINFDPQEYMNRAEFLDAFVNVAKEVPLDPAFTKNKPTSNKKNTAVVTSLFKDVSTDYPLFNSINTAATRGIVLGNGKSDFRPEALITVEEAITMMINSMGLESLAPNPAPVTSFKDNDTISSFARPSMYVAEKIGLIQEDAKGYIHPKDKLTKAKGADMMKAYIDYMSSGIRSDYMDKIVSY